MDFEHEPVLKRDVVALLAPALGSGTLVDCTLGSGGHAAAVLDACPGADLVGIDRDDRALEAGRANLARFEERVRLVRDDFKNLSAVLERLGIEEVRGVLFDLGVSSPQLDDPERGFSYRSGARLDMRMDRSQALTAHDVVNTYPEQALARVIRSYGEERFAHRIASAIVRDRPVETTDHLAAIVREAIPAATRRTGPHPARRTFQALRIEVNQELGALEAALPAAVERTVPGGRIVALSYHSLEDRIVKRFFTSASRGCTCPPGFPVCACGAEAALRILTKRPFTASEEERAHNPRAQAAKLRGAERVAPVTETSVR